MRNAKLTRWGGWMLLICTVLLLTSCSILEEVTGSTDDDETETPGQRATIVAQLDQGEQPLLVYRRSGEAEGQVFEWRIYDNGRAAAITPDAEGATDVTEVDVEQQAVDQLLFDLEQAGFYEVADAEEGECCTQNNYAITVWQDGEAQSVTVDQISPQMSIPRLQSINFVERFVYQEITANGEQ